MGLLDIWVHLYVVDMHTQRALIKGFFSVIFRRSSTGLLWCSEYHRLVSTFINGLDKDRKRILIT